VTRDRTLDEPTGDAAAIRRAAGECLKRVPLDRRIRLLGVRVAALSKAGAQVQRDAVATRAPSLFSDD
jgi:DNA polymerase-4